MNRIRQAWADGRPAFGLMTAFPTPLSIERLGRLGFDWIWVDCQHGGAAVDDLAGLFMALELGGESASVVRVPSNDPATIMRALDFGALCVIVPNVETPEDARIAASAMRYPPEGTRSFGPIRRSHISPTEANADTVLFAMIESAGALEHVDAIAATPGVDGLFVGPIDLALSLGLGVEPTGLHPLVTEAVDTVVDACRRHEKIPGAPGLNEAHFEWLLEHGVGFVSVATDTGYIANAAKNDLARIARWIAEHPIATPG